MPSTPPDSRCGAEATREGIQPPFQAAMSQPLSHSTENGTMADSRDACAPGVERPPETRESISMESRRREGRTAARRKKIPHPHQRFSARTRPAPATAPENEGAQRRNEDEPLRNSNMGTTLQQPCDGGRGAVPRLCEARRTEFPAPASQAWSRSATRSPGTAAME